MPPRNELSGKIAVVTGAGGEIGRVVAQDLLKADAVVVFVGRRGRPLQQWVERFDKGGERTLVVRADVRSERDVRRLVRKVLARFGQIDILVNNAAVRGPTGPVTKLTLSDWQEVLATNLTGAFLCARECLRHMTRRRRGCIINISSMAGRIAYPLRASYAASKWGLIGLTLTLAQEAGESNVRVNAICPGPVEGQVMAEVIARRARALGISKRRVREQFLRSAALGRMVTPSDVSRTVLFLCSEAARNITGQAIEVSGGFHL